VRSAPCIGQPLLVIVALAASVDRGTAAECTPTSAPIETDRPDVTNSSVVVPVGSFQQENGINLSRPNNSVAFDGTNTRLRVGVAPCLEVLVDLPTYVTSFGQGVASGFTNVVPAVKWQISPIPEKFDLSATVGLGLPTGAAVVAGSGLQPYVQFPWSLEIGGGWAITGMVTNFFTPADPINRYANQSTFVIERQFGERAFLFAEYVGYFPIVGGTRQLFNSGGGYRITKTQQIDFHLGVGLNPNAPAYIFGIGYSFRLDELFGLPR
jgi:Putative MetA-pathway of phenol degradation